MKKSAKIILSFVVMAVLSVITALGVYAADSANIVYEYSKTASTVTATTTVLGDSPKTLVVCTYDQGGHLVEIKTAKGTGNLSVTVNKGVDSIVANVVDVFGGSNSSSAAVYATESLDLRDIRINGKQIEGFSADKKEYTISVPAGMVDFDVIVKDATTKVTIDNYVSPGKANIELCSTMGKKRTIVVNMYSTEEETYKLKNLTYKIEGTEYEISDFNPDKKKYKVELPDDTMSVKLCPDTVGNCKMYVTNDFVSEVNGVSYGNIVDVASKAFGYKRNVTHGIIPIKSGAATVEIVVKNQSGTEENKYTVTFQAKQPVLTEFNYTGAKDDEIKPSFVGGGAVYNDNGTLIAKDRGWAVGNISKPLLGGSCFMLVVDNKDKPGQWWYNNTSGEYFNFKADRGGTIVFLSANTFTNTGEYKDNGWTSVTADAPACPEGTINGWRGIDKTWNDYDNPYFMSNMQYNSANSTTVRAQEPGTAATSMFSGFTSQEMRYGYKRDFEAGETVSVYHTGRKDGNAIAMMAVIIWDDVKHAPYDEREVVIEDEKADESAEFPSLDVPDTSVVLDLQFSDKTDKTSDIWEDNSPFGNDVKLVIDETEDKEATEETEAVPGETICGWVENGYKLTTGAETRRVALPQMARDALSSNICTIEFELASVEGEKVGIMSVDDNAPTIWTNATKAELNWATITPPTKPKPSVTRDQLVGKKNVIVLDKDNKNVKWYVDGERIVNMTVNKLEKSAQNLYIGTSKSDYSGEIVLKSLKIYNRILSEEEITGGDAQ